MFAVNAYETFLSETGGLSELLERLDLLAEAHAHWQRTCLRIGEQLDRREIIFGAMREELGRVTSAAAALSPVSTGAQLVALIRAGESLDSALKDDGSTAKASTERAILLAAARRFRSVFEDLLADRTPGNILALAQAAADLRTTLHACVARAEGHREFLLGAPATPTNESALELVFPSFPVVSRATEKLSIVSGLYADVAELEGVSAEAQPLRVDYLLSGSLWTRLIGETRVIENITLLIRECAAFVWRNRTKEGQAESLEVFERRVGALLRMRDKLQTRGLDTRRLDETLSSISHRMAGRVLELLGGESEVIVNSRAMPLTPPQHPVGGKRTESMHPALGYGRAD